MYSPKILIDSMPLRNSISGDHTSDQIMAFTHESIVPEVSKSGPVLEIKKNKDQEYILHTRNSTDAQRVEHKIKSAIVECFNKKSSECLDFLQIKSVESGANKVQIRLKKPNSDFLEILSAKHFKLKKESLKIVQRADGTQVSDGELQVSFVLIKSPVKNVEMFQKKLCDVTADTAFDYLEIQRNLNQPNFSIHKTGIMALINFENKLEQSDYLELRQQIVNKIDEILVIESLGGGLLPRKNLSLHHPVNSIEVKKTLKRKSNCSASISKNVHNQSSSLTLAFDDYYPNQLICESIQSQLQEIGITVELIKDEYGNNQVSADIRLRLLKASLPGLLGFYKSFLFHPIVKSSGLFRIFHSALADEDKSIPDKIEELQRYIDELACFKIIGEVPGYSLFNKECVDIVPWLNKEL